MPVSPPISARDCTDSVGTGPFVLLGIRAANHPLPSEVLVDGASVTALISFGSFWATGTFTYSASTHTLTGTAMSDGSNGASPVAFGAGRKLVTIQAAHVPDWQELSNGSHPTWNEINGNPLLHAPVSITGVNGNQAVTNLIAALISLGIPLDDHTTSS